MSTLNLEVVIWVKSFSLLHANVDINNDNAHDKEWEDRWYGEWYEDRVKYADRVFMLLAALHNVKFLKIYPCLKCS